MNRNQAKQLLPIIQAFSEGKCVEAKTGSGWISIENMSFAGNPDSYRIQPEPKYRPFENAEECWKEMEKHQPFIKYKVIESSKDIYLIIQRIKIDGIETDVERLDFETAFKRFTFADGTTFGVKEET